MSTFSEELRLQYHIDDFTVAEYRKILQLAKQNYQFETFDKISLTNRFILWRHDCDLSLNRALRLAMIENEESITATYFINPHCEFYNLLEKKQGAIINKILELGHHIGLHFDASFYDIHGENQLDDLVAKEAAWLRSWFGYNIHTFSFHNPTPFLLSCEKDSYGGLLNCYSSFFKDNVAYCSDSNGYWRFRRLRDVLTEAKEDHLQVLTHPGWWQETAMLPRDRVLRCFNGRAQAGMNDYDAFLQQNQRKNVGVSE